MIFMVLGGGAVLLVWLGLSSPSDLTPAMTEQIEATVVAIVDGDTITVVVAGDEIRVRLLGIDAPETGNGGTPAQCGADTATERLASLLPTGTVVWLRTDPRADQVDAYSRWLRYVDWAGGLDMGQVLIEEGLVGAWYPAGEPEPHRYEQYQSAALHAQLHRVGSWAACGQVGR